MKALVTGAAGFIGSHVVRALLEKGHEVTILDHRIEGKGLAKSDLARVAAFKADISDAEAVREAGRGCEAIFHCAALVGVDRYSAHPARTMEIEETGLRNVCAVARENKGTRVIYMSSSAVYGNAGGPVGLREDQSVAPTSNYGVAKRFNELYLESQLREHRLTSAALRIFNVYGPGQDERLVIPRFIRRARKNEPIEIFGLGAQTRDFVYIDDLVEVALVCSRASAANGAFNVCSGREISVRELAEMIRRIIGSSSQIIARAPPEGRLAFEVDRCFGSLAKLRQIIPDFRPTPLEVGLEAVVRLGPHD